MSNFCVREKVFCLWLIDSRNHIYTVIVNCILQAQRELGILYTEGPDRDMKKAVNLFQQATQQTWVEPWHVVKVDFV